jgi:hypothetical protein
MRGFIQIVCWFTFAMGCIGFFDAIANLAGGGSPALGSQLLASSATTLAVSMIGLGVLEIAKLVSYWQTKDVFLQKDMLRASQAGQAPAGPVPQLPRAGHPAPEGVYQRPSDNALVWHFGGTVSHASHTQAAPQAATQPKT